MKTLLTPTLQRAIARVVTIDIDESVAPGHFGFRPAEQIDQPPTGVARIMLFRSLHCGVLLQRIRFSVSLSEERVPDQHLNADQSNL